MGIKSLISSILQRLRPKQPLKEYPSYDLAKAASDGYENNDLIKVVSHKTRLYRETLALSDSPKSICNNQILQNMFVLCYIHSLTPLHVLDLGGACGAHYFELSEMLPYLIKKWHVVETSSMADEGKINFQDDALVFFDDLEDGAGKLESRDLLIAQGVLQYLPRPLQTLDTLLGLGFSYVYFTRTVVAESTDNAIITKQVTKLSDHGPNSDFHVFPDRQSSQPLTILPQKMLLSKIAANHEIIYSFNEGKTKLMKIGNQVVETNNVGYLLKSQSKHVQ